MTRGENILALGKDICLPAECEEALRCACAFTAAAGILRRRGGGAALGFADDRRWRCVTRMAVDDGDRVAFQGRSFRVRNARAVYLGGELCHSEAILTAEGEAAE